MIRRRLRSALLLAWALAHVPAALRADDGYYTGAAGTTAAGASYDSHEDFEDAGTPTTSGGTWSGAGSPDPDSTATVLEGAQSLALPSSASYTFTLTTDTGSLHGYFILQTSATPASNTVIWRVRQLTSNTTLVGLSFRTNGALRLQIDNGATSTTDLTWANSSPRHVWWQVAKGTGADAVARIWISTTSTKPGSPTAELTAGAFTTDVHSIIWGSGSDFAMVLDDVILDADAVGSAP